MASSFFFALLFTDARRRRQIYSNVSVTKEGRNEGSSKPKRHLTTFFQKKCETLLLKIAVVSLYLIFLTVGKIFFVGESSAWKLGRRPWLVGRREKTENSFLFPFFSGGGKKVGKREMGMVPFGAFVLCC